MRRDSLKTSVFPKTAAKDTEKASKNCLSTRDGAKPNKISPRRQVNVMQNSISTCDIEQRMSTLILTSIILISISVHCSSCQSLVDAGFAHPPGKLADRPAPNRASQRMAADGGQRFRPQKHQQQQTIPAANPNFEAAFQGECAKNNNNPCEHICLDLHDGTYECSCFYGFTLAVDGYSCAQQTPAVRPDAFAAVGNYITSPTTSTTTPPTVAVAGRAPTPLAQSTRQAPSSELRADAGIRPPPRETDGPLASPSENGASSPGSAKTAGAASAGGPTIEQSANDNRKLVDELAGGETGTAAATKSPPAAGPKGIRRRDDNEPAAARRRPRQRRLPGAVARIRQEAGAGRPQLERSFDTVGGTTTADYELGYGSNYKKAANSNNNIHPPKLQLPTTKKTADHRIAQPSGKSDERDEPLGPKSGLEATFGPQTTTTTTADTIDSGNSNSNEGNKGSTRGNRLSYDVYQGFQPATLNWTDITEREQNGDFIELNLGFEDLGPEIRSIMINNDKLVALLANSVASSRTETKMIDDDFDGPVNVETEESLRQVKTMKAENKLDWLVDSAPGHGASGSDAKQDYEMNLLMDLVGRTIEDNFRLDEAIRLESTTNQDQSPIYYEGGQQNSANNQYDAGQDKINEPFSNHIALNQSSYKETEHRKLRRRSHGHPIGGHKTEVAQDAVASNLVDTQRFHHNNNSPPKRQFSSSSMSLSGKSMVYNNNDDRGNRLCGNNSDDHADQSAYGMFRNCSEMAECEANGGQCAKETTWVSRKDSDLAQLESQARCRCPLGRGGQFCQKAIQRFVPKFTGQSYLTLPMNTKSAITNLRLVFKPEDWLRNVQSSPSSSLLLHSQQFLLVLDDMQRVELRYSTTRRMNNDGNGLTSESIHRDNNFLGKITRVLGSRDAELNKWNELLVTDGTNDNQSRSFLTDEDKIILVIPEKIHLDFSESLVSDLHVAGNPTENTSGKEKISKGSTILDHDKSIGGFRGCIKELSVNDRVYNFRSDLDGDSLDGYDVVECDC